MTGLSAVSGVAMLLAVASAAGCAPGAGSGATATEGAVSGTIVVLAASSLTVPFEAIADSFEHAHPTTKVALSFDASSALATAIEEGAPADVFVAADQATMDRVIEAGDASGPAREIATNAVEIAVATGNPRRITGLGDLRSGVSLALCREEVPCGAYAAAAFRAAHVEVPPAGREANVRAVLTKVRLGEADAGIVYRTDVRWATGVDGVAVPPGQNVRVSHPALRLLDAPNPAGAAAFLAFLEGPDARRILSDAGFGVP